LQDAKATASDPAHISAKETPEASFLPSLFNEFLKTLYNIVPSSGGTHHQSLPLECMYTTPQISPETRLQIEEGFPQQL